MYRVDRREHRHRRARRNLIIIVTIVGIAALVYSLFHIRIAPKQEIKNAPSVSTSYATDEAKKITVDKPLFSMELPAGWKETTANASIIPTPKYTFISQSGDKQVLYMHIDQDTSNVALNRAIIVSTQANGIAYDTVSENCVTFTDPSTKDPRTAHAPARWQRANFICDMGSVERAVVGTISTEGINQVSVAGPTSGQHKLFILYVDNNINPDYSTLYSILGSLHFK